jgi:glycosyltransferase involved in cell wall biosynthesis
MSSGKPLKLLLALPCFNESKTLNFTLRELKRQLKPYSRFLDIIVFDDGSSDNSAQLALEEKVIVHAEPFNRGLGENFKSIVDHAIIGNYDLLITCDADGQFPAEEVRKVLDFALKSEADLVLATRFSNAIYARDVPLIRTKGNYLVRSIVAVITGRKVSDATCGLRVYKRSAFLLLKPTEKFSYTVESLVQLLLAKLKIDEMPTRVIYFEKRESVISGSLFKYGIRTLMIATRLLVSAALSRVLRFSSLLFLPGALLISLFFLRSYSSGKFTGNLYLGLSGLTLSGFGFASFFFYLISSRIDEVQTKLLLTHNLLKPSQPLCRVCRLPGGVN